MKPARIVHPRGKTLAIEHICEQCGQRQVNKLALDDPRQPDRYEAISAVQLEASPL